MNQKKPSNTYNLYWLDVYNLKSKTKSRRNIKYSGKWMLFYSMDEIDNIWEIIKYNTQNGSLGPYSKVSTMRENSNPIKVICVYTNDYRNKDDSVGEDDDVERIGLDLINLLNLSEPIYYQTKQGKKVSLYMIEKYLRLINNTIFSIRYSLILNAVFIIGYILPE